ncbi:hypothetical protein TrLO_g5976 [Triparma laevis f. longispina]|uniref:Uncharacterized protein n=1 Tax=Triparma laevis f. longispina TaxID=1714387 RepID=A0A9W7FHB3_9STRA|nr:hypothetical protein TrLO_g5976 [Triparma laevis f. longispina]
MYSSRPTNILTFVAVIFCSVELLTVYMLLFDEDAVAFPDSISLGAFSGYRLLSLDSPASRQLRFYSCFVANNKLMMCCFLGAAARSESASTRILSCFFALGGCVMYFWRMHWMLTMMEEGGDVKEGMAKGTRNIIGFVFVPLWALALAAEIRAARAEAAFVRRWSTEKRY